jgi:hypothetical protein
VVLVVNPWRAEVDLGGAKRRLAQQLQGLDVLLSHALLLLRIPPSRPPTYRCRVNCSYTDTMASFSIRAFIPPLKRRCLPLQTTRRYAVQAPGAPMMEIFSGQQKWLQKERAAADKETSRSVDYLRDEVASRLCERVLVRGVRPWRRTTADDRRT